MFVQKKSNSQTLDSSVGARQIPPCFTVTINKTARRADLTKLKVGETAEIEVYGIFSDDTRV